MSHPEVLTPSTPAPADPGAIDEGDREVRPGRCLGLAVVGVDHLRRCRPGTRQGSFPLRGGGSAAEAQPSTEDIAKLHQQPAPPFPVPGYRPLRRLREALEADATRTRPLLSDPDLDWLHHRAGDLIEAFETTGFPLGHGLVHADAHEENVVLDDTSWVLIDWDNACHGPRELNLVGTLPDHFHWQTIS